MKTLTFTIRNHWKLYIYNSDLNQISKGVAATIPYLQGIYAVSLVNYDSYTITPSCAFQYVEVGEEVKQYWNPIYQSDGGKDPREVIDIEVSG